MEGFFAQQAIACSRIKLVQFEVSGQMNKKTETKIVDLNYFQLAERRSSQIGFVIDREIWSNDSGHRLSKDFEEQ